MADKVAKAADKVAKSKRMSQKPNEWGVRMTRMNKPTIAIVGVAALSALVPACSSNSHTASPSSTAASSSAAASSKSTSSATSTSAAAAPADYTTLLVQGSDISAAPPNVFTTVDPPMANPNGMAGAAVQFKNQDDTNRIGDTVLILPDAGGATTAMNGSLAAVGSSVIGGNPQPVAVGSGGTIVAGTSPDKSKSVTVLLFTEGKAFVTLEFDGSPNDPVPADFAQNVAQQQDAAIKKNLAS